MDVSPDSSKLALYVSKNPARSFTYTDHWTETTEPVGKDAETLRAIEIGTWKSVFASSLPAMPYFGTFFADGQRLYVDVPGVDQGGELRLVADVLTGGVAQRVERPRHDDIAFAYYALRQSMLLGIGVDHRAAPTLVFAKVDLPGYTEIQRTQLPIPDPKVAGAPTAVGLPVLSSDRRVLICAVYNNLKCLLTNDLAFAWSQKTEPELTIWRMGVSADGNFVAAAVGEQINGVEKKYHVGVFDGQSGKELTRVPVQARDGLVSTCLNNR